jgi:hypothetical protein
MAILRDGTTNSTGKMAFTPKINENGVVWVETL